MINLEITPEIKQNWIDSELQMVNYEGDGHPAVYCHDKVGEAIYGDKLQYIKDYIYDNCDKDLKVSDLIDFEVKNDKKI